MFIFLKKNLLSLYTVTCTYVIVADQSVFDKQLVCSSPGKTIPPSVSIPQLPVEPPFKGNFWNATVYTFPHLPNPVLFHPYLKEKAENVVIIQDSHW